MEKNWKQVQRPTINLIYYLLNLYCIESHPGTFILKLFAQITEWVNKKMFRTELCLFEKCSIKVSCGETLIANIPSKPITNKVQTKNILKDQMWTIIFDNQQLQYITLHTVIDYSNKINYLPVAIQRHKNSKDWYFQLIWNWKTNPNDNI